MEESRRDAVEALQGGERFVLILPDSATVLWSEGDGLSDELADEAERVFTTWRESLAD